MSGAYLTGGGVALGKVALGKSVPPAAAPVSNRYHMLIGAFPWALFLLPLIS